MGDPFITHFFKSFLKENESSNPTTKLKTELTTACDKGMKTPEAFGNTSEGSNDATTSGIIGSQKGSAWFAL